MSIKKTAKKTNIFQRGQTMIETLVAIFVLTMGITAAVGLATFALNSSTNITDQIVGMGLARESIEAVKNMRDTNWLKQTAINANCYNYQDTTPPNSQNSPCYKDWQKAHYCIDPTDNSGNCEGGIATQHYYLLLDVDESQRDGAYQPNTDDYWDLVRQRDTENYGLSLDTSASGHTYYVANGTPCDVEKYCRRVSIFEDTAGQYTAGLADMGPRLRVITHVWWSGKKCPQSTTYDEANRSCRIVLTSYLTNWKNY